MRDKVPFLKSGHISFIQQDTFFFMIRFFNYKFWKFEIALYWRLWSNKILIKCDIETLILFTKTMGVVGKQ